MRTGHSILILLVGTALLGAVLWRDRIAGWLNPPENSVILIVADDISTQNVAAYGSKTAPATPNISALATNGLRFTDFTVAPTCTVTRGMLMTGLYPTNSGIGVNLPLNANPPQDRRIGLDVDGITLAEVAHARGYRTVYIGKWHLAGFDYAGGVVNHPRDAGFRVAKGVLRGVATDFTGVGAGLTYNSYEWCEDGVCALEESSYITTKIVDTAIAELAKGPVFMYIAFQSAHSPYTPPDAALYDQATYDCVDPATDQPDCYKACIQAQDTELGRLFAAVDWATTDVIWMADNGTPNVAGIVESPEVTGKVKGSYFRGGTRVPLIVRGRSVHPDSVGQTTDALVSATDVFNSVAEMLGSNYRMGDSVSFVPLLRDHTAGGGRTISYVERFRPAGGPPDPDNFWDRMAITNSPLGVRFKYIEDKRTWVKSIDFYDTDADPTESSPLDTGALTADQQTTYDAIAAFVANYD